MGLETWSPAGSGRDVCHAIGCGQAGAARSEFLGDTVVAGTKHGLGMKSGAGVAIGSSMLMWFMFCQNEVHLDFVATCIAAAVY